MKKIICLFLSFNLTFANLENFNVGTLEFARLIRSHKKRMEC